MSSRSHKTSRHRVKFSDDSQASVDDQRTYVSKKETTMRTYEGPRFPGLHNLFKHKTAQTFNEEIERPVEHSEDEDIDTEATAFIKRKHHLMELQKLKSMNVS